MERMPSANLIWLVFSILLFSQYTNPQQAPQKDATIRVKVGLVQTDVMVFDKQGRFVPDLTLDQFELRIDGKAQAVSFLELVSAGTANDDAVWARQEGRPLPPPQTAAPTANPGRTLFLFVDDWHMAADSLMKLRSALENLIHGSVGPRDRVAILAASGQLGTEPQLTGDKAALISSLGKLNFKSPGVQDLAWPPMTEGQAFMVEQDDMNVITYFVQNIIGQPVVKTRSGWQMAMRGAGTVSGCEEAERETRRRAAALVQVSTEIGDRMLSSLRSLLRAAEELPGRNLVFFLSDGFVLQSHKSNIVSRITDLSTAAARAGIVIYSLDTRGLVVGIPDAKTKRGADMTGALAGSGYSETMAGQDALNALAADTGGRFLKNTNALETALSTALSEMSRYYLLGWYIDLARLKPGKFSTIKAAIQGRPDLTVRVRQGSLDLSKLVQDKK